MGGRGFKREGSIPYPLHTTNVHKTSKNVLNAHSWWFDLQFDSIGALQSWISGNPFGLPGAVIWKHQSYYIRKN
jgi:hypothetical protein